VKITQLQAENVKRLKAIEITPDGAMVVVGGTNGQGKSSVLDSIMYALGGASKIPSAPLRNGTDKGHVTVKLDDLEITRKFRRQKGGDVTTSLEVRRLNGDKVVGPQQLLDSLVGKIAFDPLEFSRYKPKEQLNSLKELLGLDFSAIDTDRAAAFSRRTDINRQLKAKDAELAAAPLHEGVPTTEVSIDDLGSQVKKANEHNEKVANERRVLDDHMRQNKSLHVAAEKAAEAVAAIEKQIADLQRRLAEEKSRAAQWGKQATEDDTTLTKHREITAALPLADVDELLAKISEAQQTNRKVQQNAERAKLAAVVKSLQSQSDGMSKLITELDDEKAKVISEAKMPVDGLGFTDEGVTLHGLPLEQASTRDRIQLSVAIGLAVNPKLPVMLIREGSLLFNDENGLGLIAEMAEKSNAQVWIERVSLGEECSVIISDGMIEHQPDEAMQEASA